MNPAAARKSAVEDLRKKLGPTIPTSLIELIVDQRMKHPLGIAAALNPADAEKVKKLQATRADAIAKATTEAQKTAAQELKNVRGQHLQPVITF